jgi:hypothetical protein
MFVTGFLTAQDDKPKFDGTLDAKIGDLRRIIAWLGGDVPNVASDRLRKATVKGRIVADPQQVQGLNLDMTVDASRITGGITLALRKRLAFGASFAVDRLNLDGYLAPTASRPPPMVCRPIRRDHQPATSRRLRPKSGGRFPISSTVSMPI